MIPAVLIGFRGLVTTRIIPDPNLKLHPFNPFQTPFNLILYISNFEYGFACWAF